MKSIRYHKEPMRILEKRRKSLGISQPNIAKMLGISIRTYSNWVANGATTMSLFKINRLLVDLELQQKKAVTTQSE